jgi:hypothetical protein
MNPDLTIARRSWRDIQTRTAASFSLVGADYRRFLQLVRIAVPPAGTGAWHGAYRKLRTGNPAGRVMANKVAEFIKPYRVTEGGKFRLKDINRRDTGGIESELKQEGKDLLQQAIEQLCRCRVQESNPRPSVYKTVALPTELTRPAADFLISCRHRKKLSVGPESGKLSELRYTKQKNAISSRP